MRKKEVISCISQVGTKKENMHKYSSQKNKEVNITLSYENHTSDQVPGRTVLFPEGE